MAVIGMIGPNGVGKTTAARRWLNRYAGKLLVVFADDLLEDGYGSAVRVKEWKGKKDVKAARALYHKNRAGVTLIESALWFSPWLSVFGPGDDLIVLTCPGHLGKRWLQERRAGKKNPKPLSHHWTDDRLEYTCRRYLLNTAARVSRVQSVAVKHFELTDRARDWPKVDEYFGRVFRRLHNRLNREVGLYGISGRDPVRAGPGGV
jgi:hypothetical protein